MPYWSIAEWRARIGCSWSAMNRPKKIKSSIRHGARIGKKELTLNRIVNMLIILTMLIGVNIGVRGLVASGHHHQLISLFGDFLGLLHRNVLTLNFSLVFTLVFKTFINFSLKRSQWHSVICGTYNSSLVTSFILYLVFLIIKMIYPAMDLHLWLIPAVAMTHVPDMERIFSLLRILIKKRVKVVDLKSDQNRSLAVNKRENLRMLCIVSCIVDVALSVAASVIATLLLLSGDIEQNPGPDLDYNSVDAAQTLNKDDLIDVLEAVLPIKSVYFALGRSLRLETADLKSIREAYPGESDAELALSDTLELWLQQKYNSKRFGPPTWRMLVEAVDRKGGGNNRELAKEIASNHPVTGATATQPSQSLEKRAETKDVPHSVTTAVQPSQSHKEKTETEDACLSIYNLREVFDRTWPYRAGWMYIGIELGIEFSTLEATKRNCITAGGVEDCLMTMISIWLRNTNPKPTWLALDKALQSERVSSTAAHDVVTAKDKRVEYNAYLKSLYKACMQACYHDEDHWPPPVTDKVFRLAMIKEEKVERRKIDDDFVMSTITGKVDDILQRKEPVELENIFKEAKGQQRKVLIEGAPGCGKSTLSQHICHQWAEGKLFQEYKQVILVRLREQEVQNAKDVADMLPRRHDSMGEEIAKALSDCDGQDVLFIFDGWDEMPQTAADRSVITNILNSTKLHKCSVIITSRPIASMSLLNMVNSRVEILGFTNDELRQYFADCLDNDNSKVDILQQKIKEDPVVAGICYLPLNASILVHLFKCDNELPTTQFDIFCALICNCIYRHLKKATKDEVSAIKSLDKLPQNVVAPYRQICGIAYKGVMEEMIIFELDSFNTLGLLQGVESFAKYGMLSRSYNFLHLSIQELLAAVHMATHLDDKQQVEQFTKLFGHPRFSAVFRFYAARTKLETPGIKDIVIQAVKKCLVSNETTELTPSSDKSHQKSNSFNFGHKQQPLLVSLLHCLYEAQDKDLCQLVAAELKQKLDLDYINLDPADCLSVGYMLTCCKDFEVDLEGCNIGDDGCKTLFKPDGDYSGLLSLDLGYNSISAEGAMAISIPMETMTNLQELTLYGNPLGEQGVRAIPDALKAMNSLQLLNLGGVYLGSEGAVALSKTLKSKTTLRKLYLHSNSIGDDGAKAISEAMKTMTNLQMLNLSNNSIGDDGAKAISEAKKALINLEELYLYEKSIGDDGAKAISKVMKTMTNLQTLNLEETDATQSISDQATDIGVWKLPGVEECAEKSVVVHSSQGQLIEWSGLRLHIHESSLPKDLHQCTIYIKASLAGDYEIPENSSLVSAVFWLRCEPQCTFTKPITVEIQHCSTKQDLSSRLSRLKIIRAYCNQKQLPYKFKPLGGRFDADTSYGAIEVNSFSGVGVIEENPVSERMYYSQLFYRSCYSHWQKHEIHIIFTWNTEAHINQASREYPKEDFLAGCHKVIELVGDVIEVALDAAKWTKVMDGQWEIQPAQPMVTKAALDDFKPGRGLPNCVIEARPLCADFPQLLHQIILRGIKPPHHKVILSYMPSRTYRDHSNDANIHVQQPQTSPTVQSQVDVPPRSSTFSKDMTNEQLAVWLRNHPSLTGTNYEEDISKLRDARINGYVFLSLNESRLERFGVSLGFQFAIMSIVVDLRSSLPSPVSERLPSQQQSPTSRIATPTTQHPLSSATAQQARIDKLPTLDELVILKYKDKGEKKKIRIIADASHKWKMIASLICDDANRMIVLEQRCHSDPEECLRQTFIENFINKKPLKYSQNWDGLIELLGDVGLEKLAENVKHAIYVMNSNT